MSLLDKIKQESTSPTIKINPRQDELAPLQKQEKEKNREVNENIDNEQLAMISVLEKELETLPQVVNKKMGVRLEENIYSEIRLFCQKNNITLETLLEAYFTICQDHPTVLNQVIENAQHRVQQRTKAGNIRSILTKTRNIQANRNT